MAEVIVSAYPAALDDNTSLAGNVVNMKSCILASDINDSTATIPTTGISGINAPCYLLLDSELIYAPTIVGTDFTSCTRGADGTTAAAHTSGINIDLVYAANLFNQLKRAIIAIETELGIAPSAAYTNVTTRLADLDSYNYLINGGFDFAQRQAAATLTAVTDNKCGPDRWRVTRENADVQYQRVDATGESGLTSKFYGLFKKITNAGKFHVVQILEGVNSVPLRSKTVIFQIKMKASSAKTIRLAVLELQNAGTLDTIPGTLVTAFGADTTDPTLGANVAVITAAESKSVTTAWQSFSVSVTVPSNSKNLLCAFWTDADFSVNDTLSVAEAGLFYGDSIKSWIPRLTSQDLQMCYRYYWKTFALDSAPAQNFGVVGAIRFVAGKAGALSEYGSAPYPVSMRISPTLTFFNPSATNAQVRDSVAAADCSATATGGNANERIVSIFTTGNASTAVGNALDVHLTAEAEL